MKHEDSRHQNWIRHRLFSLIVVSLLFYVSISPTGFICSRQETLAFAQESLPELTNIGVQTINMLLEGQQPFDVPSPVAIEPEPLRSAEGAEAAIRALQDFYDADEETANDEFAETTDTAVSQRPLDTSYLFQVLVGLFIVCATIILLGYAFRRFGKNTPFLAGASLGKVLGRIHLAPKSSLTFVQAGNKVLVVGVTTNTISLICEYDSEEFYSTDDVINQTATSSSSNLSASSPEMSDTYDAEQVKTRNFLDELRAQSKGYTHHSSASEGRETSQTQNRDTVNSSGKKTSVSSISDDDIASLRGDLQRLRQYLQEDSRE